MDVRVRDGHTQRRSSLLPQIEDVSDERIMIMRTTDELLYP
jgi:hypothetical protein